ncbi:hypothetical protein ACMC5O_002467 [Sphingomonas sediminicola]|uniref:hypothetical protein n=1 Tax=Sphingomonas sediminicola TaxID=386874 RepID=UPI003CF1FF38
MNTATLRQRLIAILNEEERPNVDWHAVEDLCTKLSDDLENHPNQDCPHIVHHFLADADIRAKDAEYGRKQRVEIRRFADTGECDDSKPVSGRGCLAVAIVCLGALLFWWLS